MASVWLEAHGKAVVVKGDTMQIKDFLKLKGGKWNSNLKSWIFPGSKKAALLQDLQNCGTVKKVEDKTGSTTNGNTGPTAATKNSAAPQAPKKRAAAEGESEVIQLDDNVRVEANAYQGKIGVDIRRFWTEKASGELRPGKGLRMSQSEWEAICAGKERIDEMLKEGEENSWFAEGDVTVSITGGSVDLRRFYTDKSDGEKKPGKQGIRLSAILWGVLKAEMANITKMLGQVSTEGNVTKKPKQNKNASTRDEASPVERPEHAKWKEELTMILQGRDLQNVSLRKVREELEAALEMPKDGLLQRKEEVKNIVTEIVQSLERQGE
ncbi:unnamed protein product [Durusdinium trenchii]|uniref:DEK-C domain-containing protein n=1 Tax=Durusdinium trenchii TaxID=1381693 RepID=A0ABP0Q231_9DINO